MSVLVLLLQLPLFNLLIKKLTHLNPKLPLKLHQQIFLLQQSLLELFLRLQLGCCDEPSDIVQFLSAFSLLQLIEISLSKANSIANKRLYRAVVESLADLLTLFTSKIRLFFF